MLFTVCEDEGLKIRTKPTIWFCNLKKNKRFQKTPYCSDKEEGGETKLFLILLKGLSCVTFLNLEREFASIPGSPHKKHKGTS